MTIYILNSGINAMGYDGIVLREKDFHPCHSFFIEHPEILPEKVDKIVVKGVFERCHYLRAILRYCDYMLMENGILEVHFYNVHFEKQIFVRARNEWQYELSLVFGDRALLIEQNKETKNGLFVYKKIRSSLPPNDSINKWSFGIVSSGRLNNKVAGIIKQIESLAIPTFEIIICGPAPSDNLPSFVRVLDDSHLYPDLRIPISRKKNYIIEEARYNNIVLLHDRYSFPPTWFENMKRYGNYFDVLVCNIVDEDKHVYEMPSWGWYKDKVFPNSLKDVIHERVGWLNKEVWGNDVYIPGGFFIFKKHTGLRLNPNCNWGEMEDVDFCRRAYNMGMLLTYDKYNTVYCTVIRSDKSIYRKSNLQKAVDKIKEVCLFFAEQKRFADFMKCHYQKM